MSNRLPKLLIVDDDTVLSEMLRDYLNNEGFDIESANSAEEALGLLKSTNDVSLIILDIMMPGMSGLELLPLLRTQYLIPVIMLTGRGDDIDKIVGLEMGADDYMAKPCNPRELSARIRSVLRRTHAPHPETSQALNSSSTHGSSQTSHVLQANARIKLKLDTQTLFVNDTCIETTNAEFNVLRLLIESKGSVISRQALTEQVLHRPLERYDRSIDVHISRIRQKFTKAGEKAAQIKSVRGAGYQWLSEVD